MSLLYVLVITNKVDNGTCIDAACQSSGRLCLQYVTVMDRIYAAFVDHVDVSKPPPGVLPAA